MDFSLFHFLPLAFCPPSASGHTTNTMSGYVMTIDSDSEDVPQETLLPTKKATTVAEDTLNADFTFDLSGDPYSDLLEVRRDGPDIVKGTKPVRRIAFPNAIETHRTYRNQSPSTT